MVGGASQISKGANAFYEMFIQDLDGNLIDVPVLVSNFRDSDGQTPNTDGLTDNSKLVHRFFISDTISAIDAQGGFAAGDKLPIYIRYAKSVQLRVQLDDNEQIKRPILYITYEEYAVDTINSDTTTKISYFVDYYQDTSGTKQALLGLFITINIIVLIVVCCCRVRIYNMDNPQATFVTKSGDQEIAENSKYYRNIVINGLYFLANDWATWTYGFCFIVCGYYFCMFKM